MCTAGILAALAAPLARAQTPVPLRVGETRTAAQHATDRFRYDVAIEEPGAYLVRVEQRGLDLIVSVETPAGSATSFNSPLFRDGAETVLLDAEPGRYRVDLRSDEHTGAAAAHAITVVRLAPGTARARARRPQPRRGRLATRRRVVARREQRQARADRRRRWRRSSMRRPR